MHFVLIVLRFDSIYHQKLTPMRILLIGFCALFLFACSEESNKNAYIKSYNAFIEKIEKEAPTFTKADWEAAETELDEWTGIKRHEVQTALTNEDEEFLNKLDNRFEYAYAQFLKGRILNGLNKTLKDAKKEIREEVEKIVK